MSTTPQLPSAPSRKDTLVEWHKGYDALLAKKRKEKPTIVRDAFIRRYGHDAPAFVRDCFQFLPGEGLAPYQTKALEELMAHKRLAVRALHGTGKTTLAAFVVAWGLFTADDVKVPTTAGAWVQLKKYLWPEIHKWLGRFRWSMAGLENISRDDLNLLELRLSATAEAFAVASDNHVLIEGAHAKRIVYVFDESKAIPTATWDAAEGAFTGTGDSEAYALAISTPGEPAGRFYDICSKKHGYQDWRVMHVTLEEVIAAGRVGRAWAEARKLQWGENSPMYQNRVLGNFCTSDENGIIPLAWIEAANLRWLEWKETNAAYALDAIGVDVARSGDDKTVLALRTGNIIAELREFEKQDLMATAGCVKPILDVHTRAIAIVDVIGVGAGVVDRLKEQRKNVYAYNASEGTDAKDLSGEMSFVNTRAASWWHLRELLDPANGEDIMLPPHDDLTGDLCAPHWSINSSGKIKLESKDEIKVRIGRSTDHGDAVVQAFWRAEPIKIIQVRSVRQESRLIVNRRQAGPLM